MPIIAQLHDGTRLEFPDGTDPSVIQNTVKSLLGKQEQPQGPTRSMGQEIGRQAGLSVRAPIAAASSLVGMLSDPIASGINLASRAVGSDFRVPYARETIMGQADKVLPTPETGVEKFSAAVAEGGYGAAAPGVIAQAAKPVTESAKAHAKGLQANMGAQVASGASGAGAAELATDSGIPGIPSALIGVAAGMVGGKAWDAGENAFRAMARTKPGDIKIRIDRIIENAGLPREQIDGNVRQEVGRIVEQSLRTNTPIDDAQMARWAALRASGVPAKSITRAMVTRDPMDWQTEMRVQKTPEGTPLRDAYLSAETSIDDNLRGVAPNPRGDGDVGRAVRAGVNDRASTLRRNVEAAYDAVRQSPEARSGVPVAALRESLIQGRRYSTQPAVYKAALNKLDDLAQGDTISVDDLEIVRKIANQNYSPDTARAINDIASRIDDQVQAVVGDNVFRPAREANQIYKAATDGEQGIANLLKSRTVANEAVPDEKVFQKVVINGSTAELKQVVNALRMSNNDGAVDQLRAKTVEHLADALRAGETQRARFATFDSRLNKISEKLPALFSDAEIKQLKNIRDAGESVLTEVNRSFVNNSNTANDSLAWVRALLDLPGIRQLDTITLGLPGAALDAGVSGVNSRANQRLVNSLVGYAPTGQRPEQSALAGRLLLGSSLGGVSANDHKRQK